MIRRLVQVLCWPALVLLLLFVADDAWSRGRGGGGGGRGGGRGGASYSRRGPASSGSMSRGGLERRSTSSTRTSDYSRRGPAASGSVGSTRPSTGAARPSAGTLPSQRPGTASQLPAGQRPSTQPGRPGQAARPGQLPSSDRPGGGRTEDRPDREERREDWQQHQEERREDWQDYGSQRRAEWAHYADEHYEEHGYGYGYGWYGHPYYYDGDEDDWAAFAAGALLAVGVVVAASAVDTMECEMTKTTVNGETYYRCGKNWYQRTLNGGDVTYVVVAAPQ